MGLRMGEGDFVGDRKMEDKRQDGISEEGPGGRCLGIGHRGLRGGRWGLAEYRSRSRIIPTFTRPPLRPVMIFSYPLEPKLIPQIRLVFAAVKETILQNALRDSGIL